MTQNIISIVNQKGGVGKTTTAVNLSTAIAATGRKVLLIDLDPQGNASTGFGIDTAARSKNIYNVMADEVNINDALIKTKIPGLDVLSSTVDLSAAEMEIAMVEDGRESILKNVLLELNRQYDYIFIDCPPSLGMLTINALTASDSILIPLQCEFYALEGLSHLLSTIDRVKKYINPGLHINGVALTMYDKRNNLARQVESDVRGYLGGVVYKTAIPRNIRMSEAPSHGTPAIIYDHLCLGSMAYIHLAREILEKDAAKLKELQKKLQTA